MLRNSLENDIPSMRAPKWLNISPPRECQYLSSILTLVYLFCYGCSTCVLKYDNTVQNVVLLLQSGVILLKKILSCCYNCLTSEKCFLNATNDVLMSRNVLSVHYVDLLLQRVALLLQIVLFLQHVI